MPRTEYDCERLRRDLLDYYDDVALGGCGQSIVFVGGIEHADEQALIEYAQLACFKLERYRCVSPSARRAHPFSD